MRWTADDVRGTLRSADRWWAHLAEGLSADVLTARPDAAEASVAELRAEDVAARAALDGAPLDAAVQVAEATLARLSAAGRGLVALGAGAPRMEGTVAAVCASDGGVPKLPLPSAHVSLRGVDGDRQAARRHHGRVWQALCLWSAEVIDALVAEGHDLAPGRAGENVTVGGVDWRLLRAGARLRLGDVLAELSVPTMPCAKNKRWFRDGDFMRMAHDRQPGVSRWYATVLEPGTVAPGSPGVVEP